MQHRVFTCVSGALVLIASVSAHGQAQDQTDNSRQAWSELPEADQAQLTGLLASPDWPIRAIALIRLERFTGDEPAQLVRGRLRDDAWQVQCFALHIASLLDATISSDELTESLNPIVIREALRHGVKIPEDKVEPATAQLLSTRGIDELMLGLEIAAASNIESVRTDATRRAARLIRNMDDAVAALVSRRLATVLDIPQPPETANDWRAWLANVDGKLHLSVPKRSPALPAENGDNKSFIVASLDEDVFTRLLDYLDALRQRDLELVIVMDSTASMTPMINQARAGIDSLILFLNDISRTMRMAFVAYRDHDNPPVWSGHPFTNDITSIRRFLFDVPITGGADYPEAVLEGLEACLELDWNRLATREIVLVGDAPAHDRDVYKVHALLQSFQESEIALHAVHVPMQYPRSYYDRLDPERAQAAKEWLDNYNRHTSEMFSEFAEAGGGQMTTLAESDALVPAIMHFTIEEGWWPVFDEFYDLYLMLCR